MFFDKNNNNTDVQNQVKKKYSDLVYKNSELTDKCNTKATKITLTNTQEFIKRYITPSKKNGFVLYHSVGSGKTLTSVSLLKEFEKKGYNTMWVTRTTLKQDLVKALDIIPLSKKLNVVSYKQFSNIGKKKGILYKKLLNLDPLKQDPLYKTIVIVDEAHKLYTKDLKSQEMHDITKIESLVNNSYSLSKYPCKIILMSGTPITKNPMEMIKLFDLITENSEERFGSENTFLNTYIEKNGKFKKNKISDFKNKISNFVSYLDVSKTPEKFAQLELSEINSKLSKPLYNKDLCKNEYKKCREVYNLSVDTCKKEMKICNDDNTKLNKREKLSVFQDKILKDKCKLIL